MTGFDLWALPLAGDGKPVPVANREFDELGGQLSRDMRWVAYESNETDDSRSSCSSFQTRPESGKFILEAGCCRDGGRTGKNSSM